VAQVHPDPAVMLAAAERTLRLQHKDLLVTAFVAVFDPVTQECSYSNAGHPPPLLRTSDGSVHALRLGRPPLGFSEFDLKFVVFHVEMPPGCLLLLYTDGLIESTRDILQGEARLLAALEARDISVYDNVARRVHEVVLGQRSRDDVAILSVRVESAREVWRWRLDPMWADAAARVRAEICAHLPLRTFGASYRTDCEVIFSELMSNIMRYAPGTAEIILEQQGDEFVLHVLDKGPGFFFVPQLPSDLFSEVGRGLFLIANLARDFSVARRPGGGSHARVVLLQGNGAQLA
ncbi:MAG: serine/threonine-protein phosphatase, partial [Candidatus Eremiobacteraeota bacterium]|nr:serine/threonine-protein phosphatase [Candidatus Eremiobacteraeota bacterium]